MASLSSLRLDPDLCAGGVWLRYVDDVELLIARSGNPAYHEECRTLALAVREETGEAKIDTEQWQAISMEAAAKHVLRDWKNVTDKDGQPIPYTWERGLEIFNDPGYRELWNFVILHGERRDHFRAQAREVALGNSETSSSGSSTGAGTRTPSPS